MAVELSEIKNQKPATILVALNTLFEPDAVVELRIPKTFTGVVVSGYFNDLRQLAQEAARFDGKAAGIYVTLNPVNPALLARANNHVKTSRGGLTTTSDKDILRRRWLPIDFDPVRPADISSTDAEHEAALARARKAREWFREQGWPEPVFADSGNGAHLLYRIDLPNDDEARKLVERCLKAIAFIHADEVVDIDVKVGNAARIWKLYGTLSCKGDNVPERPHRRAAILETPKKLEMVSKDLLEKLAAMLPEEPKPEQRPSRRFSTPLNIEAWIREHELSISKVKPWNGGTIYELETCPFNPDHRRTARIVQFANGALHFGCFHNSCAGKDWHSLRDLLEPEWRDRKGRQSGQARKQKASKASIEEPAEDFIHETDLGNARRLVKLHGQDLRYCHPWGKWLVWDGRRWKIDDTAEVALRARDTVRSIYIEARNADTKERAAALAEHAIKSESAHRINAMIDLARSEPGIPVLPADLDQDKWLLNCLNGTLDLRTGKLRPHRREDLITKIAPVEYDPKAECPRWMQFLNEIMDGNENLIRFLQRAAGFSLTGDVREHVLFILHGTGRNGKSTFLNTLLAAMGDYGIEAAPDLLMAKQGERHPTELADLFGKRLVVSIESEEGRRLAESLVKQLTGGDKIKARRMREDFWEFWPTHKLWLATNHRPQVRGTDVAIWSRLKLIPFNVQFLDGDPRQDKALPEKLLTELPGILRWAVEGCLAWQRDGLEVPEEVKSATTAYREEMDVLANFIAECCIVDPNAKAKAGDLYKTYVGWCDENGERALSQKNFGMRLSERGFIRSVSHSVRWWHGITLQEPDRVPKVPMGTQVSDLSYAKGNTSRLTGKVGTHGYHEYPKEYPEASEDDLPEEVF